MGRLPIAVCVLLAVVFLSGCSEDPASVAENQTIGEIVTAKPSIYVNCLSMPVLFAEGHGLTGEDAAHLTGLRGIPGVECFVEPYDATLIDGYPNLCILPLKANEPAVVLMGFSHELSLTGVSFVPDPKGTPCTLDTSSLIGRRVLTRIIAEGISVEVQGEIVRTNQVIAYGKKLLAFGIHFAELSPQLRWMVFTFAANPSVSLPKSEHEYLFSCPLEHNWRI